MSDGVYGLQIGGGLPITWRSHECSKNTCRKPAEVAVFGKRTATETQYGRLNVCRPHIVEAAGDLIDPWICALLADREMGGDYCPHCATRTKTVDGKGHSLICPVGLAFPDNARRAGVPWDLHDRAACEVCTSYLEGKPGPTG